MESKKLKQKLFSEFPPVAKQSWEETIISDLKGADYEKKLVWNTDEGFKIQPYYCAEDVKDIFAHNLVPSKYPFLRGNSSLNNWEIRHKIMVKDPKQANAEALEAILRGADAITFRIPHLSSQDDMLTLINGIDLTKNPVHFISSTNYLQLFDALVFALDAKKIDKEKVLGSFNFDSFSYYLLNGKYWLTNESNMNELAELITKVRALLPKYRVINVGAQHLHNAGANTTQELGFALAAGAEYIYQLTKKGIDVDDALKTIHFNFAIGSSYFLEIAKFRAARLLWSQIVDQFNPKCQGVKKMRIHAVTSQWNKSLYDPNVNMLRTTTEAMSAAMASVDAITINPYDNTFGHGTPMSKRVARNQQIILKEEAQLGNIVDPAAGSYYIEMLTKIVAEDAWKLFLKVEELGGFVAAMESGFVANEINKSCSAKLKDVASRKTNILGTNQFPNMEETMLDKVEKAVESDNGFIKRIRRSEIFEAIRLKTESFVNAGNKKPVVFLLSFGNLGMRKARAGFATNFYSCAGFDIIDNNGFETAAEGLSAAKAAKADIIVLCSADEEYKAFTEQMLSEMKSQAYSKKLIVAGYPADDVDALTAMGVSGFIHLKTNIIENLSSLQLELGVK